MAIPANPEDRQPTGRYLDCDERPMTNAERMAQENTSATPDVEQTLLVCSRSQAT